MVTLLPAPYENVFLVFFFVLVRVMAVIYTMPVLSTSTVTRPVKVAAGFWVAVVIAAPVLGLNPRENGEELPGISMVYPGLGPFALAVMAEMAVGFVLGFIGQVLMDAIQIAGEVIGQQAGFSAASVFDPITGQDVFLMAQVNTWFATLTFLAIGGPEVVLSLLADSFRVIGPGAGISLAGLGDAGYELFNRGEGQRAALAGMMYKLGAQIAAPMIAAMVLVSVAEAFIARTVPQLNILVVGFAIRISIGLYLLYWMMNYTVPKVGAHFAQYGGYAREALARIGG